MFDFFYLLSKFQLTVSGVTGDHAVLHVDQQSGPESLSFQPKMVELIVPEIKQNPATSNHAMVSYRRNQSNHEKEEPCFKVIFFAVLGLKSHSISSSVEF